MTDRAGRARERFRRLHESGTFVMPNAWDIGSARLLESLGFPAIASTSSGFAASLGRADQHTSLDELLAHSARLVEAVDIPVSIDAEHGHAIDPEGVAETVRRIAATGAAGVSIEDYDPEGRILPFELAVERVAAAASAAAASGIVLTARAENHLYGVADLDDTVARLRAFREAGADVLYAPGVTDVSGLQRLVADAGGPVNALIQGPSPTIAEMESIGIRRVSTGGALAFVAYGAAVAAARELLERGTHAYLGSVLSLEDRSAFRRTAQ